MQKPSTRHRTFAAIAGVLFLFAAAAQAATPDAPAKPPPRLPPSARDANAVPAGVDTGSPVTSDALPLGTPISPANSVDRDDMNKRSAAARAAMRPRLASPPAPAPAPTTNGRVPAGPAPLGVNTDPRDPAATATPGERRLAPRPARAPVSSSRSSKLSRAECASSPTAVASRDAAPVALPGSGFTGSSAGPAARAAVAGPSTGTADCG